MRAAGCCLLLLAVSACAGRGARPASGAATATGAEPAVAVAGAAAAAATADDASFAAASRELALARAAYAAKDHAALLAHAARAVDARPESVAALYTLACAQALLGDSAAMRATLARLAALRVYFDLATDDDFTLVRASADYAAARAAFAAVLAPRLGAGQVAFTLGERDLLTEGLAHDPKSGAWFVTSVRKRKIVRIDRDGRVSDFVPSGRDGLWGVFALAVDGGRGALYALSAPVPEMSGFAAAEDGATGIFELDLATAALRRKVILPAPSERAARRAFNDLAVLADGTVYIGDGRNGAIVRLRPGATAVEPFVPAGAIASAQGMVPTPSGRALFVADYARGLARVELATAEVRFVGAPRGVALAGMDGLAAHGRGLVATQNGLRPHRLLWLEPSADETRLEAVRVLAINDPRLDEPTLGVVVGDDFYYIANSQWSHFGPEGPRVDELRPPAILQLRLP